VKAVATQARTEVVLTLRRGESLLVTIGIPVMLLVFFSVVDVLPTNTADPVDFLAPGVLALAVMSTAMVSLGIATGFERQYGVLKRLAVTPLGRPALLAAKTGSVVAVEILQFAVLVPVAWALGWRPGGNAGLAAVALLVATIAFAGLGMLMAGTLRAEMTLGLANGVYIALLLLGGMIIPRSELPAALEAVAKVLPAAALSETVGAALDDGGTPARAWLVLMVWAVAAPAVAAWRFRWE